MRSLATPTWVEFAVTAGIWALGLFVLTVLVRVALPIELGHVRSPDLESPTAAATRPRAERKGHREVVPVRKR